MRSDDRIDDGAGHEPVRDSAAGRYYAANVRYRPIHGEPCRQLRELRQSEPCSACLTDVGNPRLPDDRS